MKTNSYHKNVVILAVLALGFAPMAVEANPGESRSGTDIEDTDPFVPTASPVAEKNQKTQTAEMLDAQARILFARGETEKAIAMQKQAVAKAKQNVRQFSATLARYMGESADPARAYLENKLREIIIPEVSFEDVSLEEAVKFLRQRSVELDTTEKEDAKKGVNLVIALRGHLPHHEPSSSAGRNSQTLKIPELQLRNVPMMEVLRYICEITDTGMDVGSYAVTIR